MALTALSSSDDIIDIEAGKGRQPCNHAHTTSRIWYTLILYTQRMCKKRLTEIIIRVLIVTISPYHGPRPQEGEAPVICSLDESQSLPCVLT